jgi:hypothetical protein
MTEPGRVGRKMIQVFVGDDEEPHCVHRDLISASSDFFQKALNGDFQEKDGIVRLSNQDSTLFALYVQWLYSKCLNHELGAQEQAELVSEDDDKDEKKLLILGGHYKRLIKLYILGDVLQDEEFQNTTMDAILKLFRSSTSYPIDDVNATIVLENLPPRSPLRKLLVDCWVYVREATWYKDSDMDLRSYPSDFWVEVAEGLITHEEGRPGTYPWDLFPCQYHVHTKDQPKDA